jgi:hypothetical protein
MDFPFSSSAWIHVGSFSSRGRDKASDLCNRLSSLQGFLNKARQGEGEGWPHAHAAHGPPK